MNLQSMNIFLTVLHVHPAKVHLIQAVALIGICILKSKSIVETFDSFHPQVKRMASNLVIP